MSVESSEVLLRMSEIYSKECKAEMVPRPPLSTNDPANSFQAEQLFAKAYEIRLSVLGPTNLFTQNTGNSLAIFLDTEHKHRDAEIVVKTIASKR